MRIRLLMWHALSTCTGRPSGPTGQSGPGVASVSHVATGRWRASVEDGAAGANLHAMQGDVFDAPHLPLRQGLPWVTCAWQVDCVAIQLVTGMLPPLPACLPFAQAATLTRRDPVFGHRSQWTLIESNPSPMENRLIASSRASSDGTMSLSHGSMAAAWVVPMGGSSRASALCWRRSRSIRDSALAGMAVR